jgi:hypothetical protein
MTLSESVEKVANLPQLELELLQELGQQRQGCDSCSARALVIVFLPYGDFTFCLHHYNKNADVLTNEGGIAKLLSISED